MKPCPHCGRSIPDDARYCPYCEPLTRPWLVRRAKDVGLAVLGALLVVASVAIILMGQARPIDVAQRTILTALAEAALAEQAAATALAGQVTEQRATATALAETVAAAQATATMEAAVVRRITATPALSPGPTGTATPPGATRVREKDGAAMVYVPAGEFTMGSTDAQVEDAFQDCKLFSKGCQRQWFENQAPQHTVALDAFWVDRTEVTNAQYRRCVETGQCRASTTCEWGEPTYDDATKSEHPVVCVSWEDAHTYCEWAGARLPTEAEWEKAARGTDGRIYPWGNAFDGNKVSYCDKSCEFDWKDTSADDSYARTAPVGSKPEGASPYGALDMAGNVWEWVADWYAADYYSRSPARNPLGPDSGEYRGLRGGSWSSRRDNVRSAYRVRGLPDYRSGGVGVRCGMSFTSPPAPTPVPTPTPTGTPVSATPGQPVAGATRVRKKDGAVMVYVPEGEFTMGSPPGEGLDNEHPQHTVYLDAFWMDRTEVTNAQYRRCLDTGACQKPGSWNKGDFNAPDQPVVSVTWEDARTYCEWVGARLPTEAEWEKAARGTDRRTYPWGNERATCERAVMDDGNGNGCGRGSKAWPVGSKPAGASPYGTLDMAGNVWEWVADWYAEDYYSRSPDRNPHGPDSGIMRGLRGSSWSNHGINVRSALRFSLPPDWCGNDCGFRCAVATSSPLTAPVATPTPTGTPVSPTPTNTATPTSEYDAVVSASAGNLRAGPGTSYAIIGQVKQGDHLRLLERTEAGNWMNVVVMTRSGQPTGWLSVSLIELNISLSEVPIAANIPPTPTPAVATRIRETDGAAMVYVPEGEFTMGSPPGEGFDDEHPQHTVYLDAFWIDRTEVTNAQYRQCLDAGTCQKPRFWDDTNYNAPDQPVVGVFWNDAVAYCQRAGARLPSEAEWEKAARGTDGRTYPWGNKHATCERAVMDDGSGSGCGQGNKPWPVGSKLDGASPYGALDMAGNVWEWAADWYAITYYSHSPGRNPRGPDSGEARVLRGGLWYGNVNWARSAHRAMFNPIIRNNGVGFRCAASKSSL